MRELSDEQRHRVQGMTLHYGMEQWLVPGEEAGTGGVTERWWVGVREADDESGEPGDQVCLIDIVRGDLDDPGLWEMLDAMEGDLEMVGSTILDLEHGGLADDLDDEIEPLGDRVLILNSITLAEDWRGYGLGALFAGVALQTLTPGARLAVTYPAPLSDARGAEREAAIGKLGQVWARIGFKPFRGGVWVADLGLVYLDKGVEALRERFGLAGW